MINFLNLLTLLFIGLKLSNNIDWSWFVVLLPTIAYITLTALFIILFLILMVKKEFSLYRRIKIRNISSKKRWFRW